MTDTINGFPIIATWATAPGKPGRGGRIIVVDRGYEYEERYVVAWQGWNDPGWDSQWRESAYCETLKEAMVVFVDRLAREVARD